MILVKRRLVRIGEIWFDEDAQLGSHGPVDIIMYRQLSSPGQGGKWQQFHSLIIDLTQDIGTIFAKIKQDCRYKIRRASERDGLMYQHWDVISPCVITKFADFFDQFATHKGLQTVSRGMLEDYSRAGVLDLSSVSKLDGEILTWHSHVLQNGRARLLHSASHFRQVADNSARALIGRANRYHHWLDLQRFKASKLMVYDFGGWYSGNSDVDKLRINQFKEDFGGNHVTQFNGVRGVSLKGRLYLAVKKGEA
jgi:hypothetical protein